MMKADALVVGGGIAGLNAAYQLVKRGIAPVVVEPRGRCGGLVVGAPVAGTWIDLGAESYARRSSYCAELCHELGLETREPGGTSWVWSADDRVFPLPHGVLGIPASLDDPQVATALSADGLHRARADLTMGAGPGADAVDLASLVRARLGEEAYQVLVRPVAGGIYSAEPESLTTDVIIPGLRAALADTGSLVLAAARLRAAAPSGAVVSSVVGGLYRLPQEMVTRIEAAGGRAMTRTIVTRIERIGDAWRVHCAATRPGATPADPPLPDGEAWTIDTPRLIMAANGGVAMHLLRDVPELAMGDWQLPAGAKVAHVVLAVRHAGLDDGPRGSGMLVAPRGEGGLAIGAKALTHLSVKWPWLRSAAPVHFLRVSYGRPGEDPQPSVADGLADASTLLGVPLTRDDMAAGMVVHWNDSLPPPTPAHRERVSELTRNVANLPGLGVTGAWVAGNGLAPILPHAEAEAARVASWR